MPMTTPSKQNGYVIISVLLITTISSVLAVSAIGENRLQERIAGNQLKEINARANAEKGVFSSYQYIQDNKSHSIADLKAALDTQSISGEYLLTTEVDPTSNSLTVVSQGSHQGAVAYLKANVVIETATVSSDPGGVVSCEGILLTGSGQIDSFDSREGAYDASTANSNANVITIDGDLNLTGGTQLMGDLNVNGSITQSGSGTFGGDLSASGDIVLANANVAGSISSGSYVDLSGGTVGDGSAGSGNINSMGDIKLNWGNEKTNGENGNASGVVKANGLMVTPTWLNHDNFSTDISHSGATDPVMASNSCDKKDIANAFPTVADSNTHKQMNDENRNNGGENTTLLFTESSAQVFDGSGDTEQISPSSQASTLWAGNKSVYVFDDLDLHNTMITIEGDVIIMVKGDLTTSGGGTGFEFAEGDTTSSLTILVEGQVSIGSSASVFAGATVDSDSEIPLTIYSSFESAGSNEDENAVYLNGNTEMYAQVYAPLGNVEYAASGEMMGSLEGKTVEISGHGDIHYDEALADIGGGESAGGSGSVKMAAIYYHYPN